MRWNTRPERSSNRLDLLPQRHHLGLVTLFRRNHGELPLSSSRKHTYSHGSTKRPISPTPDSSMEATVLREDGRSQEMRVAPPRSPSAHHIIFKNSQPVPPTPRPRSCGQNNKVQPPETGNFGITTIITTTTGIAGTLAATEEVSVVIATITPEITMDIRVHPML